MINMAGRQEAWMGGWEETMDVVTENTKSVGVREQDAEDIVKWRQMIGCGHPWRKQPTEKEDSWEQMTSWALIQSLPKSQEKFVSWLHLISPLSAENYKQSVCGKNKYQWPVWPLLRVSEESTWAMPDTPSGSSAAGTKVFIALVADSSMLKYFPSTQLFEGLKRQEMSEEKGKNKPDNLCVPSFGRCTSVVLPCRVVAENTESNKNYNMCELWTSPTDRGPLCRPYIKLKRALLTRAGSHVPVALNANRKQHSSPLQKEQSNFSALLLPLTQIETPCGWPKKSHLPGMLKRLNGLYAVMTLN